MIRAGPIESHPKLITFTRARRTNICVRVVPIYAPGCEDPLRESVFTGPPYVIHDLALAVFDNRFAYSSREIVKHLIPRNAFPFSFATFAHTFQRIKNPIRIRNLIERSRTFRAVAPARSRILRIAFKLLNLI